MGEGERETESRKVGGKESVRNREEREEEGERREKEIKREREGGERGKGGKGHVQTTVGIWYTKAGMEDSACAYV